MNRLAADSQVIATVEHRFGDGRILGKPFAFLVEIGDLKAGSVPHFAALGLQLAEEQPNERSLADPVGADDPDAVATLDQAGKILHERRVRIAERDPRRFDRPPPGTFSFGAPDLEVGAVRTIPARRTVPPHFAEPADPAHVAGAARSGTAANPRLLGRETVVEPFRLEILRRPAFIPPPQEIVVVARPRPHEAPVDLDDAVRDPAQKCPVVGGEHEASPVALDRSLEPFDGGEIEVIRRLVEEEEIGFPDHGPGQQDPSFLPARQ